jgi:hypothetical protein
MTVPATPIPRSLARQRPNASRCHLVPLTSEAKITQAISGVPPRGAAFGPGSGGVPNVPSGVQKRARREQRRVDGFFGQPCSTPRGSCERSRAYQLFIWTVQPAQNKGSRLNRRPMKGS